jgi:uncharacterized damage-inducible protein DinB
MDFSNMDFSKFVFRFQVLLVLFFSSLHFISGQGDFLMDEHISKWQNSMEYTLEVAHMMPDSLYDFRPSAEEMTFGEQLQHMAQNMTWLATSYLMEDEKYIKDEKFKKKLIPVDIRSLVASSYHFSMDALKKMDIKNLNKSKDFFAGPMTKRQIIYLMHDHATHHRGQLLVYLRLQGIKPPKYRGW